MKEYKVTAESLGRAKQVWRKSWVEDNSPEVICIVLDALFVPEKEGWKVIDRKTWTKGDYSLKYRETPHYHCWAVAHVYRGKLYETSSISPDNALAAQVWADVHIAKYEAKQSQPPEIKPGPRLRAKYGNILVIISDGGRGEREYFAAFDLEKDVLATRWNNDLNKLRDALLSEGATIIE